MWNAGYFLTVYLPALISLQYSSPLRRDAQEKGSKTAAYAEVPLELFPSFREHTRSHTDIHVANGKEMHTPLRSLDSVLLTL